MGPPASILGDYVILKTDGTRDLWKQALVSWSAEWVSIGLLVKQSVLSPTGQGVMGIKLMRLYRASEITGIWDAQFDEEIAAVDERRSKIKTV